MYGMIHQAARDFALSRLGPEQWEGLLETGGLSGRQFIGVEYYSDEETMRIVSLIAGRLGLDMAETFRQLGGAWVDFAGASTYGRVLQMAGDDLETFLSNLDRMHASIKSNMPKAALPGFEVVSGAGEAIRVQYRSERRGLAPFVQGILASVAERFGETLDVTYVETEGGALFTLARRRAAA
jgi:hypothetical protein